MVIAISAFSIGLFSQETPESFKEIPRDHIRVERDVVYAVADGHILTLDIAYPDNLIELAPAIVDIPGGAWRTVRKSSEDAIWYARQVFVGVFAVILFCSLLLPIISAQMTWDLPQKEVQGRFSHNQDTQRAAERNRRENERPGDIVQLIGVLPGMKIGEVGAGNQFRDSDTDEWRRTHVSVFVAK